LISADAEDSTNHKQRAEDMLGDATDWLFDHILIKLTLKSRMRRRRADVDMVACVEGVERLSGRTVKDDIEVKK
jgi:hypothetical protein